MPHRKTMNVSLTPELDAFVVDCVSTGRYGSNSEVIRAALRLLQGHEQREPASPVPVRLKQQRVAAIAQQDHVE